MKFPDDVVKRVSNAVWDESQPVPNPVGIILDSLTAEDLVRVQEANGIFLFREGLLRAAEICDDESYGRMYVGAIRDEANKL